MAGSIIAVAVIGLLWLAFTKQIKNETKRVILFIVIGAETCHSLMHAYLWHSHQIIILPWLVVTDPWNLGSAIVNGTLVVILSIWAYKLK